MPEHDLTRLQQEAAAILRQNDRGGYTVPTLGLYPYQWLWDAGFAALGWLHVDPSRAWLELETLQAGQWAVGMLPHITFHRTVQTYFPGPDVWQSPHQQPPTSGITQPPVLATALRALLERDPDRAGGRARALFLSLLRYHRWLFAARDPEETGLVAILHPWESGMDNSPLWDAPLSRIVPGDLPPFQRLDTSHVNAAQRPSDEDYRRYIHLLVVLRSAGYVDPALYHTAPFCLVDTAFNSILLRANRDLLAVAEALDEPAGEIQGWIRRMERGFDRLRDGNGGFLAGLDLRTEQGLDLPVTSRFLTLWAGAATRDEADRIAAEFRATLATAPFAAATVTPGADAFQPVRYWRGPVWGIVNWMLAEGFAAYGHADVADRLRSDTLRLVGSAGFYEYFNPLTGEGLGGPNFSWTAAIVLQLLGDRSRV